MAIIIRNRSLVRMPQVKLFFRHFFGLAAAAFLLFSSSACRQRVMLNPGEDDLVVLNGCVVSACNYLAVVKTQHALDKNFWAKILLVRFENHPAGHAYCVWIAIVLAQELARILNEPLAVSQAEFVDSSEAELYTYSSLEQAATSSPMATFVQMPSLTKP